MNQIAKPYYKQSYKMKSKKQIRFPDWLSMILKPVPNQRWKPVSLQNLQPIFNC